MANIRKQFNFRNGVQVDDDNLIVNPLGLVGIGTTIPTELLDVRGTAKVVGLVTATEIYTEDLTALNLSVNNLSFGDSIIGGGVSITSGIITASSGVVTYYGDGGRLLNLPTSQWLDIDIGLGFTSIYAQGNVGVATNDPIYTFQVGSSDPVSFTLVEGFGVNSIGDVLTTGIITAVNFSGIGSNLTQLNASNIAYGTISNDRIPTLLNSKLPSNINVSGIVTATGGFIGTVGGNVYGNVFGNVTGDLTGSVTGDVVGTASTAESLTGTPDIDVNDITASSIDVDTITGLDLTGEITLPNTLRVGSGGTIFTVLNERIGFGTALPSSSVQINKLLGLDVELVSETEDVTITLAQGTGAGTNAALIRFGNDLGTFDILNRDIGDINMYLHAGNPGIDTGRFNWIYGQNNDELMSLTYDGRLGLGRTDPDHTLHVVGTSTVTGDAYFGGNVSISGNLDVSSGSITLPSVFLGNVFAATGISSFFDVRVSNDLNVSSRLGISTSSPKDYVKLDVTDGDATFGSVGVGTTSNGSVFRVTGGSVLSTVAIGNTNIDNASGVGVYGGTTTLSSNSVSGINSTVVILDSTCAIGVGTTSYRSAADFADAGKDHFGGVGAFMILPRLTTSQIAGLSTVAGAVIFNLDTVTFQGYTGTTWVDLH